jgi:hypothetical protein
MNEHNYRQSVLDRFARNIHATVAQIDIYSGVVNAKTYFKNKQSSGSELCLFPIGLEVSDPGAA